MKFDNNNVVQFHDKNTTAPYYAIYPLKNDSGAAIISPVSREELHQWLDHDCDRRLMAYPRKSKTQRTIYKDRYDDDIKSCDILDGRTGELLAIVCITDTKTRDYCVLYTKRDNDKNVLRHIKRFHWFWY